MANRIELSGRLATAPSMRVTPAGTAVMSIVVDCGERAGEMRMPIVLAGEHARELTTRLKAGLSVRARGSLRPINLRQGRTSTGLGVEVVADEVTLAEAAN
ncbi:MAG TPA: single-stranded DNA-binding protein [Candidatus Binataceae bacterium]|nr:single-stranded DNA-binding protein [Candidatus Binataceae bacterium]